MIEKTHYGGWTNNVKLSNGMIELVVTLDIGPRIIRFANVRGPNMFAEFPTEMGNSGEAEWRIRGGHRFWHAPEASPRTYVLDNHPVHYEPIDELSLRVIPVPPKNSVGLANKAVMDLPVLR